MCFKENLCVNVFLSLSQKINGIFKQMQISSSYIHIISESISVFILVTGINRACEIPVSFYEAGEVMFSRS
jgi:hypothetical protein